jgi:vacuolar-type H+-ATPase subunit F/Vma7
MKDEQLSLLTKMIEEYLEDSNLPYFLVIPNDNNSFYISSNIRKDVIHDLPIFEIARILNREIQTQEGKLH